MSDPTRALTLRAPPRAAYVQSLARPIERAWAVILLSVISGAYLPLVGRVMNLGYEADSLNSLAHAVLLPLYALAVPLILTNPKGFVLAAWRGKLALVLIAFACASMFWSVEPRLSLFRGISLLAPTAVGLILAVRFTNAELLRLLAYALGIPAVASALVVWLMPEQGISSIDYGDAWRGVYFNKNGLARSMGLASGVFVLMALDRKRTARWAWLGAAGTIAILLLARSVTSVVATVAMLLLIPLYRSLRLRSTTGLAVWTVSILTAAVLLTALLANLEPALMAMGRDTTLTGRTDIWAAVMISIAERPWLGYGHNAFWDLSSGPAASVVGAVGWETPHSHNGFLDLWLDLGLVGVTIYLLGLFMAGRAAVMIARRSDSVVGIWPLLFLSFFLILNVAEAAILRQHNLFWVLYVAVLSSVVTPAAAEGDPSGTRRRQMRSAGPSSGETGGPPRSLVVSGPLSPGIQRAFRSRGRNG